MKLLLHVAPLLLMNLGSYVLIKLVRSDSLEEALWIQLALVALLGVIYAAQMVLWLWVGKHYQLSFIYPLMGINYVLSLFVGMAAFGEAFSWQATLGSLIITVGVVLISTSPHRDELNAEV